jgi:hypothetical protein
MTLSFTVAILLAMAIMTLIVLNPKVMKLYMNYAMKKSIELMEDAYNFIPSEKEA